jgi:hypothetical protein
VRPEKQFVALSEQRKVMVKCIFILLVSFFAVPFAYAGATSPGDYYVVSEKLNVRLAPNKRGKITNTLYKRQKVEVFEIRDSWARVSRYYDGTVEGLSGDVARWVFSKHLSTKRPAEEKVSVNSPIAKAIKSSDDFAKHQQVFESVSEKLVNSGKCKLSDFQDIGGWLRSTAHKPKPVYFTYCGGMSKNNRIYVNTLTGKTFR